MKINQKIIGEETASYWPLIDIVCSMELAADKAKIYTTYGEVKYHFCSNNCKQHFDKAPERYIGEK